MESGCGGGMTTAERSRGADLLPAAALPFEVFSWTQQAPELGQTTRRPDPIILSPSPQTQQNKYYVVVDESQQF
jgi:hypothetical protein